MTTSLWQQCSLLVSAPPSLNSSFLKDCRDYLLTLHELLSTSFTALQPSLSCAASAHRSPRTQRHTASCERTSRTGGFVRAAVTAGLPSLLKALQLVESASLSAERDVVHDIVSQLPTVAPSSLTKLRLSCRWGSDDAPALASPEFFQSLCQLNLQHLECQWDGWYYWHDLGIAALQPLTQLTALSLRGWRCMDSPADWQALAGMTRLQQLCLDDRKDLQLPHDCIPSLQPLSCLTSLTLRTSAQGEQVAPGLVAQLPPQSLPQLQELTLTLYHRDFCEARAFTEYIAALPALQRLAVHLFPTTVLGLDEWTDERQKERMAEVMAARERVEACLRGAAASAGVVLTLDPDAYDNIY